MYAYCLFCETRRCRDIAFLIQQRYNHRCFSPRIIQRKWVKGTPVEEQHDWLPGYVFVYTEEPLKDRIEISGILRCLGDDVLKGRDREFALMLHRLDGVLASVKVTRAGDRCRIADPAWIDMDGEIVKLDRGRQRCCVEFEFDGAKRTVWVGYDMVELI